MLTGDDSRSAIRVASRLGLLSDKSSTLEGKGIENMADDEWQAKVCDTAVFALFAFNHSDQIHQNIADGRNLVFASLAINSMIYIFAYRGLRLPLWRMNRLVWEPSFNLVGPCRYLDAYGCVHDPVTSRTARPGHSHRLGTGSYDWLCIFVFDHSWNREMHSQSIPKIK